MAYLAPSSIYPDSAGINPFLDAQEMRLYPYDCALGSLALSVTAKAEHLPLVEPQESKTANYAHGFGLLDWYNRVHVTPTTIACGNIVTPQTQSITIWNAWISAQRTLTTITPTNADGITVTAPAALPSVYKPLQVKTMELAISNLGPPNLSAIYLLTFDNTSRMVYVTGSRIVAWTVPPDWSRGVLERLEWRTDVMTAHDGSEQRVAIRQLPRRSFEFEFWTDSQQLRRKLEALLWNWGALVWALPIWTDGTTLSAAATAGDTTVSVVSTSNRDFIEGGLAVFITDALTFEVAEILSVGSTSLVLARQLERGWSDATRVYPARTAYLQDHQPLRRWTHENLHEVARFTLTDDSECTPLSETTYRSFPVLEQVPVWAQDISADYARKVAVIDFGNGGMRYDDEAGIPTVVQSHQWTLDGKAQIAAFRAFLYARRGKYSGLWVPSFLPDLRPVGGIAGGGATIDVEHCFYTLHLAMAKNRRDIRILLNDGTVYYRRITAAQELSASVERLTVDTPAPSSIALSDINRISFMTLSRMDSDGVELQWSHDDVVESTALWRSTNNDV